MNRTCGIALALFLSLNTCLCYAQIRLPKIIGDQMVLQRNKQLPIWGWAKAGKPVKVVFAGHEKNTIADSSGYWRVTFPKMRENNQEQQMVISSDTSIMTLKGILIGEVWFCSGQSNMEYTMKLFRGYAKPVKGIDSAIYELEHVNCEGCPVKPDNSIRLFNVEKVYSSPDVTSSGWHPTQGEALEKFSAAGYFFAKDIYDKLHIPIGMIAASWGGSRIESWTPPDGYKDSPDFSPETQQAQLAIDGLTAVGKMYKSMVRPIAPYALRGFLWYQGEANAMINEKPLRYVHKMQILINSWRRDFENPKAPFYSVLIGPYYYSKHKDHVPHTEETLPEFWEQQITSVKLIPNTDLITVTDLVDDPANIHPSYKWEVGRRLSFLALAKDYGDKKVVYSGPRYKRMVVKGDKVILYFNYSDGLRSSDGKPLTFFTIAGSDGRYVTADAAIKGKTVILSSRTVLQPQKVRFGWTETAMPNLVNAAGLPALPFRTDQVGQVK